MFVVEFNPGFLRVLSFKVFESFTDVFLGHVGFSYLVFQFGDLWSREPFEILKAQGFPQKQGPWW